MLINMETDQEEEEEFPPRRLSAIEPRPEGVPSHISSRASLPSLNELLEERYRKAPISNYETRTNSRPQLPRLICPTTTELTLDGHIITVYNICGKQYTMQAPIENETISVFKRTTLSGRTLSYRLRVIQEPSKARACGNGPRSSADRRPVDPPPVVKLTIYDGDKDITNAYEAGFMLFASLEFARPIAFGRMHQSNHIYPVLTGVCVAGAAYLQRPKNAAYFIFPDLSVRHEGWYRLKFHLFEQIKHRDDADPDRPFVDAHGANESGEPQAPKAHENMANRTFVYSAPFQVFSAKKFPGLNTSTELSKIVADQGCRVRIRRDIRQRRSSKKDKDEDHHGTPRALSHERSQSHESFEHQNEMSRRMSIGSHTSQGYPPSRTISMDQNATNPSPQQYTSPHTYHQSYPPPMAAPLPPRSFTPQHFPQPAPIMPSSTATSPQDNTTPTSLPSVSQLLGNTDLNMGNYRSNLRGGYALPEPQQIKRSHRPYESEVSLKDGARPPVDAPRQSSISSLLNNNSLDSSRKSYTSSHITYDTTQALVVDDDNAESDSEDSLLGDATTYRRANGNFVKIPVRSGTRGTGT